MADYEAGLQAISDLVEKKVLDHRQADSNRNEASTRYHIIDYLIGDVLHWPKENVAVEVHEDTGYSDYEIGSPPMIIVEAKRERKVFEFPAGWSKETANLSTITSVSVNIREAIVQAMDYALQRGVPYGAITNGHQLIAFLASRLDGVPPMKGKALVFKSQVEMKERFNELWDALSPPGIQDGNLKRRLQGGSSSAPPAKLSAQVIDYPGYKNRNPSAADLQILGGLFLEDVAREPGLEEEFLQDTYCMSGALSQYALVSKELLLTRYASTFEKDGEVTAAPATTKKGLSRDLEQDVVAAGVSKRPILLVGDVGVGKSIFVRHLIKVTAKDALKRALVLYIDFGSKPTVATDLEAYVSGEIVRQIREEYDIDMYERNFVHGVYHGELMRFDKGIYGDLKDKDNNAYIVKRIEHLQSMVSNTEEHLKKSLLHISKGQQRQIVVFLDNVDQRPPAFQETVFMIAQTMADQWPLTAFVSLRPETFALSRDKGSLAAYQPRVFTISPPRVDQVLVKRLEYAKKQLIEHGTLPSLSPGIGIQSSNLILYVKMLLRAFRENDELVEFIDNMSNGNIRKALNFVSSFVGSGHVDSEKILRAEEVDVHGYTLPLHEFLRAAAHGDHELFEPASSPFLNMYDISTREGKEHFVLGVLVSYVERVGQFGGKDGYVERAEITKYGQKLGFHSSQIKFALNRALHKGLIATPVSLTGDDYTRLRITTAGVYTVRKLMFMFAYLDAVIVDTPIVDPEVRSKMDVNGTIMERLDRVDVFLDYLESHWKRIPEEAEETFDWAAEAKKTRDDINKIRQKLEKFW